MLLNHLLDKKVIFFDMGNTLLDFHQHFSDEEKDILGLGLMKAHLQEKGIAVTIDELKSRFLDPFYNEFPRRMRELVEIDVYPFLSDYPEDYHDELLECFYQPYKEHIVVNAYAIELLALLKGKGLKIGIISNCFLPSFLYKDIFKFIDLDQYIDTYVFSYDLMIRKPKKEIFHAALSAMNVKAEDALMIGDGLRPDILGASEVGMESIWYNHKHLEATSEIEKNIGIIYSFGDLLK